MSNYATKKNYIMPASVYASNLVAKQNFIALKTEILQIGVDKLVHVPTSLNNVNTKLEDLDVGKSKSTPEK